MISSMFMSRPQRSRAGRQGRWEGARRLLDVEASGAAPVPDDVDGGERRESRVGGRSIAACGVARNDAVVGDGIDHGVEDGILGRERDDADAGACVAVDRVVDQVGPGRLRRSGCRCRPGKAASSSSGSVTVFGRRFPENVLPSIRMSSVALTGRPGTAKTMAPYGVGRRDVVADGDPARELDLHADGVVMGDVLVDQDVGRYARCRCRRVERADTSL